jgi:arginine/ornithine transport system ATP-binding protein
MYRRARLGIGYLPQESSVFQKLSVSDNLLAVLETMPYGRAERLRRMGLLMEDLSLTRLAGAEACTLSGGERARVLLARALAVEPEVMLFDEPTSALDPELVTEVLRVMQALAQEGRTMLVVTHEMGFAREVANHLIFLHKGLIEEQGVPREVLSQPKSDRLAQFLSGNLK